MDVIFSDDGKRRETVSQNRGIYVCQHVYVFEAN